MISPQPPICLIAPDVDVRVQVAARWGVELVTSLAELHVVLKTLAARRPEGTRTLDLIGHATRDHCLIRFGDTAVDMMRPSVARMFQAIRQEELLQQLGVIALRLLGCSTAVLPTGQRTMQRLARTLEVPVYGSLKPLMHAHYTADGFNPKFEHVLVEASQLPNPPRRLLPTA